MNPVGEKLAGLWREVLETPRESFADGDDFFAVGGTSMRAMALVQRISDEFGAGFGLGELLADPSFGAVARAVGRGEAESS
ncbi:acyl carrier protein [Umezawaea tangerina]|uniref:Phosphopantetheine binding protein n=1 Tax=Umezawaea tangerina TaxID=84725 RepID=A0A2T0STX0_9PSEU|nr:acyl carrier protein [Umezawaea tangerina]PRY36803.1 phosphopantetheine binding protein [Umezawaea tangerina]